jgi:sulfatase modifying factor 1
MLCSSALLVVVAATTIVLAGLAAARCPDVYMTTIPYMPSVCIDRFEASVLFYNVSDWQLYPFYLPIAPGTTTTRAISCADPWAKPNGNRPQAYISQVESARACRGAGKRLCSKEEFLSACLGPENYTYSYGPVSIPGVCNTGQESPIQRLFGPHATYNLTEMNDPACDQLPNSLAAGGAYPGCRNSAMIYDMVANLDEWTSEIQPNGHGVFRGGYFVENYINGLGCLDVTIAHAPTYHDYSLGFRCCVEALV